MAIHGGPLGQTMTNELGKFRLFNSQWLVCVGFQVGINRVKTRHLATAEAFFLRNPTGRRPSRSVETGHTVSTIIHLGRDGDLAV